MLPAAAGVSCTGRTNPMDRKRREALQQIDRVLDDAYEDDMYTTRLVFPHECRELDAEDARNRARKLLSRLRDMEMFEHMYAGRAIFRLAVLCRGLAIIGND